MNKTQHGNEWLSFLAAHKSKDWWKLVTPYCVLRYIGTQIALLALGQVCLSVINVVRETTKRNITCYGSLPRYVKLRVVHAPGMPGTFSPPPRVSDPDMHVPWCMSGSLTSGFLWSQLRGKRYRHSRRMRNPQFYVSGKIPIPWLWCDIHCWYSHSSKARSCPFH